MVLGVECAESLPGHVSVDLRGADVRVAKHRLHGAKVGAMNQEVRRESMAQGVW